MWLPEGISLTWLLTRSHHITHGVLFGLPGDQNQNLASSQKQRADATTPGKHSESQQTNIGHCWVQKKQTLKIAKGILQTMETIKSLETSTSLLAQTPPLAIMGVRVWWPGLIMPVLPWVISLVQLSLLYPDYMPSLLPGKSLVFLLHG